MKMVKADKRRDRRINEEIVVDAYSGDEQAMGWHAYLEDVLSFPFSARCSEERIISPLRKGDKVEVTGMAPGDECSREMFVTIPWEDRELAVPLMQLTPGRDAEPATRQAIADWLYWVRRGYEFSGGY